MVEYKQGDILNAQCEALVNTVNCVGVMGRGVALHFKERFPENFKAYKKACDQGQVLPGKVFVFDTGKMIGPRWILNFPTKRHWRGGSRMEDIAAGLDDLKRVIRENGIKSIALPPLGCGLGGLDWNIVKVMIGNAFAEFPDLEAVVHEPGYGQDSNPVRNVKPIAMTPGRAALVALARNYLRKGIDPTLTLLKVHKLMYFLQVAGEPLNLKYVKAHYGPYAENLRHFLQRTEGHLLYGFYDDGERPNHELNIVPYAIPDADAYLQNCPDTCFRIAKVDDLVEGFESSEGLELLASVHWVCREEDANSSKRAYELVHSWNKHKEMFTEFQVESALSHLRSLGWLNQAGQVRE